MNLSFFGTAEYFKQKLWLLSIASILFFASFGVSMIQKPPVYVAKTTNYEVSKLPILGGNKEFPVLSAQGVYAYDLDSGVVLYEKNPDEPYLPASTTKIVTALVALDYYDLDEKINTGSFKVEGSKMGLFWNEEILARDLLYGLLVYSGNDAAEVLASNFPGGRSAFIDAMNDKARELFAVNSSFVNPSGLDELGQMTTAKDLARISSQAMLDPEFAKIVSTGEYQATSADGKFVHKLENRNELLGKVSGVLGIKTGWTEGARENLVTYVNRDGKRIITTILGSQDRFGETEELVEWIYGNYEWKDVSYSQDLSPRSSR